MRPFAPLAFLSFAWLVLGLAPMEVRADEPPVPPEAPPLEAPSEPPAPPVDAPEPPALPTSEIPTFEDEPPIDPWDESTAPLPGEDVPEDLPPERLPTRDLPPLPLPPVRPAVLPDVSTVLDIRKTHNVAWRGESVALRLDLDFAIVGERGSFVGAAVDFYTEGGAPIQSILYPYANRSGQVGVWTKLVKVEEPSKFMTAALVVPYRAFPRPGRGDGYGVVAVARLVKHVGRDRYEVLAEGRTSFRVECGGAGAGTPSMAVASRTRAGSDCAERIRRWKARRSAYTEAQRSPERAREMWKPFCSIPGA